MNDAWKKRLVAGLAVAAVGYFAYSVYTNFGGESTSLADHRVLQDINTGRNYRVNITREGYGPYPHESPDTGESTLYPTEVCYWDQCGEAGGTRVILNTWRKLPEPTSCPVCGHTVRIHNPRPPGYKDDK